VWAPDERGSAVQLPCRAARVIADGLVLCASPGELQIPPRKTGRARAERRLSRRDGRCEIRPSDGRYFRNGRTFARDRFACFASTAALGRSQEQTDALSEGHSDWHGGYVWTPLINDDVHWSLQLSSCLLAGQTSDDVTSSNDGENNFGIALCHKISPVVYLTATPGLPVAMAV
jgi:hypothetical protein